MSLFLKLFKIYMVMALLFLSSVIHSDTIKKPIVIYKQLILSASKNKVWSALTENKELSKWWNKGVRLEPFFGGQFYEPWGEGQLATGKVLELKKMDSITFTWHEKYWKKYENTKCTFTLKELSGTTVLEVRHSGWEIFKDSEKRARLVKGFRKGWDDLLPKLKKHIELSH